MSEPSKHEFNNSGEALKKLQKDYEDWCSILTAHSIQAAYAIIAGNWVVHRSTDAILKNSWAKWSLIVVFVFLGFNLFCDYLMASRYYNRCLDAEGNSGGWQEEFNKKNQGKDTPWPYTKSIQNLGKGTRWLKVWAPIIGALLLVLSFFLGSPTLTHEC